MIVYLIVVVEYDEIRHALLKLQGSHLQGCKGEK